MMMVVAVLPGTCWMEFSTQLLLEAVSNETRCGLDGMERNPLLQDFAGDGKRYAKNPQSLTGLMGWTTREYHESLPGL